MKYRFKIVDSFFSHNHSASTLTHLEQNIIWDRNVDGGEDMVFFTNNFDNTRGKIKIALLIESPIVTPHLYNYFFDANNRNKFNYILTFDERLLKLGGNVVPYSLGGCWIEPNEIKIHSKSKNVSIISSHKNEHSGHKLRHEIISKFKQKIDFVCGRGYKEISNKIEALKDYRYSLIVENFRINHYFSEKLTDCFSTGTVPIYWGCESITNFFNDRGMIVFTKIDELNDILNTIGPSDYDNRMPAITENFEKCKSFQVCENNILASIQKVIPDNILQKYKIG